MRGGGNERVRGNTRGRGEELLSEQQDAEEKRREGEKTRVMMQRKERKNKLTPH